MKQFFCFFDGDKKCSSGEKWSDQCWTKSGIQLTEAFKEKKLLIKNQNENFQSLRKILILKFKIIRDNKYYDKNKKTFILKDKSKSAHEAFFSQFAVWVHLDSWFDHICWKYRNPKRCSSDSSAKSGSCNPFFFNFIFIM